MVRQKSWRLMVPLLVALMLIGGLWTAQPVGAADGVNVSNMDHTYSIADGVSPDGYKVCVVWSRFDVDPQAFVRVFDVLTSSWNPPLGSAPFQVSSGSFGGVESTRCAYDTTGTLHVVWQQKESGPFEIMHRSLPANGNPANAGSWSGITTVDDNGDGSDIVAFQGDNSGRVWLVHRKYQGDSGSQVYVRSRQNGSWSQPHVFTTSGSAGNPRVGVDNAGYVHFAWKNGSGGRAYAYYNSNNGTFSQEIGIPGSGQSGNFSMAVNKDNGDVHIIYAKNFNEIHYVKKTGAGSTSFGSESTVAYADDRTLNPQIAWSPGTLYIVFDSGNKSRIDYITSVNQGSSWSGIQTVASPGGGAESPWVSADPVGNAYIAYAHRSDSSVYFTSLVGYLPPQERCAGFADVRIRTPACPAIDSLSQSDVIKGYATDPPTFGPNKPVTRAEMSAFLVRALGWESMPTGPKTFNDFGPLVGELRDDSLILANACTDSTCVANGYGDGTFGPNNGVTYAQVMTFIARAFVYDTNHTGWSNQPNGPQYYSGVPAVHDADVRTYNHYAGEVTDVPMPSGEGWNQTAPRAWVAVVLYQALQSIP